MGHHRHDRDEPDVVYVDDAGSPEVPATTPRRQLDGTVMLLPTSPPLPAIAAIAASLSRWPTAPLRAHFALPPERPPR